MLFESPSPVLASSHSKISVKVRGVISGGAIQLYEKTQERQQHGVQSGLGCYQAQISANMSCPYRNNIKQKLSTTKTNFSIENILAPDFGKKFTGIKYICILHNLSPLETSPENCKDSGAKISRPRVSSGNNNPTEIPAWIFCTRYSDRPSSGTSLIIIDIMTAICPPQHSIPIK